jgi:hypothetical protein
VIVALAALTNLLSPVSFETDGGRVEEDQLERCEQVTPSAKECLVDDVPVAPGSKRRLVCLLRYRQFVAESAHRPIEVLALGAIDPPLPQAALTSAEQLDG